MCGHSIAVAERGAMERRARYGLMTEACRLRTEACRLSLAEYTLERAGYSVRPVVVAAGCRRCCSCNRTSTLVSVSPRGDRGRDRTPLTTGASTKCTRIPTMTLLPSSLDRRRRLRTRCLAGGHEDGRIHLRQSFSDGERVEGDRKLGADTV